MFKKYSYQSQTQNRGNEIKRWRQRSAVKSILTSWVILHFRSQGSVQNPESTGKTENQLKKKDTTESKKSKTVPKEEVSETLQEKQKLTIKEKEQKGSEWKQERTSKSGTTSEGKQGSKGRCGCEVSSKLLKSSQKGKKEIEEEEWDEDENREKRRKNRNEPQWCECS